MIWVNDNAVKQYLYKNNTNEIKYTFILKQHKVLKSKVTRKGTNIKSAKISAK